MTSALSALSTVEDWLNDDAGRAALTRLIETNGSTIAAFDRARPLTLIELMPMTRGMLTTDVVADLVREVGGDPGATEAADGDGPPARPHFLPPAYDDSSVIEAPRIGPDGTRTYRGIRVDSPMGYRPLALDLMVPAVDVPAPLVVYIHGGGFLYGSRRSDDVGAPLWAALLEAGFAVASIEYRLSSEAIFPACMQDVAAAVRWLRAFAGDLGAATERIGVVGESAGGHLAALLGVNSDNRRLIGWGGPSHVPTTVQAVVCWYPATDLMAIQAHAAEIGIVDHGAPDSPAALLIGAPIQEARELSAFASPVTHASAAAAPMLLMHGREDAIIPYQQSESLAKALRGVGTPVEVELIEGADHVFMGVDRGPIIDRTVRYLASHLR